MTLEVSRTVIADSTCLIVLAKIESLELLHETFGEVIITPEIHDEFGENLPDWIRVVSAGMPKIEYSAPSLGRGERSAIQLASVSAGSSLLILDDWNARKFANKLGLNMIGTLGMLIEAKALGKIGRVRPLIERIRETNFFLNEDLVAKTLILAGEEYL